MSYSKVVVGTDGSESALKAVERAGEVAARSQGELLLICVYTPATPRARATAAVTLGDTVDTVYGKEAAEAAIDASARRAQSANATNVSAVMIEGDPAQALLGAAQERGADLIVVGNRGLNTLSGRLLGSVPSDVVHRATSDVLIVYTTAGGRD